MWLLCAAVPEWGRGRALAGKWAHIASMGWVAAAAAVCAASAALWSVDVVRLGGGCLTGGYNQLGVLLSVPQAASLVWLGRVVLVVAAVAPWVVLDGSRLVAVRACGSEGGAGSAAAAAAAAACIVRAGGLGGWMLALMRAGQSPAATASQQRCSGTQVCSTDCLAKQALDVFKSLSNCQNEASTDSPKGYP